jgi:Double-GTPase 2
MICPYCLEDVPAGVDRHEGCKVLKDQKFPDFYLDFHGGEGTGEPLILSVVGSGGHGKTVYLCALFDFLDHQLTDIWPKFYNHVLDQDSLSRLITNRNTLDKGGLPERTAVSFPRPGIFRLTKMPHLDGASKMPPLEDTTVLICDPPGEAFETMNKIGELASFIKRSSCVLFLIDITALSSSIAAGMAKLLDTYVLAMRDLNIKKQSQHLIVVYTKSDKIISSVPEFQSYLAKEPRLKEHLSEQTPKTLANPHDHLAHLEWMSHLLEDFTRSELKAGRFMNVADDWFATVSYTAVSSLGSAPEEDEKGNKKMTVKMSPRCVVDPLLFVLAKSIKVKPPPPPPPLEYPTEWFPERSPLIKVGIFVGIVLILLVLLLFLWLNARSSSDTQSRTAGPVTSPAPITKPPSPPVSPPSPPVSLPGLPVSLPRTVELLTAPSDSGTIILNMPRSTMVALLEEKTDSNGKTWVRVSVKNQRCQIGRATCTLSSSCEPSVPVLIAKCVGWVSVVRVDETTKNDEKILVMPDDPSQLATLDINAKLRTKAGIRGADAGIPMLILLKGAKVRLTGEEERMGDTGLWKKIVVTDQNCCVCPPQNALNADNVFTVLVAQAEGWMDKALLNP